MTSQSVYWVVFPLSQAVIAIIAGALLARYGAYVASKMGGGILQKTMISVSLLSFLLAAYTIFGLWGYFSDNDLIKGLSHAIILIMSLGVLVLAYYTRNFADELKKMESEE